MQPSPLEITLKENSGVQPETLYPSLWGFKILPNTDLKATLVEFGRVDRLVQQNQTKQQRWTNTEVYSY